MEPLDDETCLNNALPVRSFLPSQNPSRFKDIVSICFEFRQSHLKVSPRRKFLCFRGVYEIFMLYQFGRSELIELTNYFINNTVTRRLWSSLIPATKTSQYSRTRMHREIVLLFRDILLSCMLLVPKICDKIYIRFVLRFPVGVLSVRFRFP